jgi:predicted dehydrogenase
VIRVCLVGAGRAGLVHGRNFAFRIPEAELVAVVDEDPEARARAARELRAQPFASLEEALERVPFEAVCVATPTFTHRDLVVRAAEAGKHVLCEKPMALDVPQALAMIRAAERAGVVLQVGFMRRFDSEFRDARTRIASGELGRLLLIRSTTRGPGLPPPGPGIRERDSVFSRRSPATTSIPCGGFPVRSTGPSSPGLRPGRPRICWRTTRTSTTWPW